MWVWDEARTTYINGRYIERFLIQPQDTKANPLYLVKARIRKETQTQAEDVVVRRDMKLQEARDWLDKQFDGRG